MYCKECGKLLNENENFCTNCGEPISNNIKVETKEHHVPKCFDIFAMVGYGLGLGSIIGFMTGPFATVVAIYGIVFSALGKRSIKKHDKASTGLTLSIVATILSFIFYVSCVSCIALQAASR